MKSMADDVTNSDCHETVYVIMKATLWILFSCLAEGRAEEFQVCSTSQRFMQVYGPAGTREKVRAELRARWYSSSKG